MRELCDKAIDELPELDAASSDPPPGYPSDFYTDKYRIEPFGNDFRIVTYRGSGEVSVQAAPISRPSNEEVKQPVVEIEEEQKVADRSSSFVSDSDMRLVEPDYSP